MSYGPNIFQFDPNSYDPSNPRYAGMNLPIPLISPQFQTPQMAMGERRDQALMPIEQQALGPMMVNAIPGDPNVSNPTFANVGGMGAAFGNAPSPALDAAAQRFQPMPTPAGPGGIPASPDSLPTAPRQYADASMYDDYPATTGSVAPAPQGNTGFLGKLLSKEDGNRLERAGAWFANPANAQAALGFRNADASEAQQVVANSRAEKELALKQQAQAISLRQLMAKNTSVSESANGKFRIIQQKNPMTGEVTISRQPIPEDEQSPSATQEGKDPSAMLSRAITDNNSLIARNAETLAETDKVLDNITAGKVSFGAFSQGTGALKNYAGMSDENSRNIAEAQRILQNLVEDRMNMEKGGGSNEKLKQVMAQVIPQGSAYYDTKQWETAIRLQRKLLADRTAATLDGNAQAMRNNTRLAQDVDPATGRPTHELYSDRAKAIRADQEAKSEAWHSADRGGAVPAPAAPRVVSPLDQRLRDRFGAPGAR